MSLPRQDQANILHGIMGQWIMRSGIMNNLLFGKIVSPMTTMEKWIGNEEEGSLIPRDKEILNRIQGHELRDNKEPTTITWQFE